MPDTPIFQNAFQSVRPRGVDMPSAVPMRKGAGKPLTLGKPHVRVLDSNGNPRAPLSPRVNCGIAIEGRAQAQASQDKRGALLRGGAVMVSTVRQTQAEANAFWADKDYKKWVVDFTTGGRRNRRTAQALVGAATSAGARRAGVACMEEQGKPWVRSAMATVRLATAQDLGCVYVGGKGGAA